MFYRVFIRSLNPGDVVFFSPSFVENVIFSLFFRLFVFLIAKALLAGISVPFLPPPSSG